MSYAKATRFDASRIPVIDIGPLRDGRDPGRVARAIHAASESLGFLYVSDHGIADADLANMRELGLEFFRQTPESKRSVKISAAHRGYLEIGGARMDEGARSDLKESFVWGDEHRDVGDDSDLRGPNQWPASIPGFRESCAKFYESAHIVARHLLRAFAIGLDLAEDTFLAGCESPVSRASLVYYPPQPVDMCAEQFGVAPHTDFGVLTVLCQDHVGGLQVQLRTGHWVAVDPIAGALVVNVGDLLARWTNDRYRSTPHRVINASGEERLSLVLAYDPAPDTPIDASLVCGPEESPRYHATSCGDYLRWRFAKAFDYRES